MHCVDKSPLFQTMMNLTSFFNKKDKLFDKKIRCDCYGYLWGEEARSTGNKEFLSLYNQLGGPITDFESVIGPGGPITDL